jgi:uncharacterized damage-inducible protein DinB
VVGCLGDTRLVGYLPPMSAARTEIDRYLHLLREAPERIAAATAGVDDHRLHQRSAAEPWSVNDILAHIRASADMREKYITDMASGDPATLRYESPRGWIRKTNHLELPFAESLAAHRTHRFAWLAQLETMSVADWERGAVIRDRPETIATYVRYLADHETVHCDQIEALLR